ncbi:MAG: DMT family transporter [Thermoplasmata archaeon]
MEILSVLFIFIASISWSVYTVISKKVLEKYDALFITSLSSLLGTVFLLPFLVNAPSEIIKMNSIEIFSLGFLVVIATFLAFYLNFKGVQILNATRASVFYYLSPVFTIISAYFLIHEVITITMIIGGILIIGGVAIVNK